MGIRSKIKEPLNSLLARFGLAVLDERRLYDWQTNTADGQEAGVRGTVPAGAAEYLRMDNPRLVDLKKRYAAFDDRVTTPLVWTDNFVKPDEMLYFRGDNAYVWQVRMMNMNIMAYALTTYFLKSDDPLGLFNSLDEDEYFGVHTFKIDGRLVSRDLLDSISDIYFLEKHLGLSGREQFSVLDIGAGYGRLAHRLTRAMPNIREYICTDAFPISTFISEYYLRYRGADDKAVVVPLDEIDEALGSRSIDVAVNIHSFSECRISAIEWWLEVVSRHAITNLMIVVNTGDALRTNDGIEFAKNVEKFGYRLTAKEPMYADPIVQKYAITDSHRYLFERID